MELMRYQDEDQRFHIALVAKEGRKWMQVVMVKGGGLKAVKRPLTDKKYMQPLETNERKAKASLRRMARKRGTSRVVRAAIKEI